MTRAEASEKLYKRNGSSVYYFDIRDAKTGKRIRRSTGEHDKEKALDAFIAYLKKNQGNTSCPSVQKLIEMFSIPEKNPKYLEAQLEGGNYGYGHACHIAAQSKNILFVLRNDYPNLLHVQPKKVTTNDFREIKNAIAKRYGKTCKSFKMVQCLKGIFSFAVSRGWMQVNPAAQVRNISYEAHERPALDMTVIRKILRLLDNPSLPVLELSYFAVLATTGMRRAEALALRRSAVKDGIIAIKNNLKPAGKGRKATEGSPKWGKERAIPMPAITARILEGIEPVTNKDADRYFPYSYSWSYTAISKALGTLMAAFQEDISVWEQITPHVLRHSLISTLYLLGCPKPLLERWFGWAEGAKTMQDHYLHIYTSNLRPVARTIDFVFSDRFTGFDERFWAEYEETAMAPVAGYFDSRPISGFYDGGISGHITADPEHS